METQGADPAGTSITSKAQQKTDGLPDQEVTARDPPLDVSDDTWSHQPDMAEAPKPSPGEAAEPFAEQCDGKRWIRAAPTTIDVLNGLDERR